MNGCAREAKPLSARRYTRRCNSKGSARPSEAPATRHLRTALPRHEKKKKTRKKSFLFLYGPVGACTQKSPGHSGRAPSGNNPYPYTRPRCTREAQYNEEGKRGPVTREDFLKVSPLRPLGPRPPARTEEDDE